MHKAASSTDFSIDALIGRKKPDHEKEALAPHSKSYSNSAAAVVTAVERVCGGDSDRESPQVSSTTVPASIDDDDEEDNADDEVDEPSVSKPTGLRGACTCDQLRHVQCTLETSDLWKKFHDLGTEMIITKTGRRMFPTVRVSFSGVRPDRRYLVVLDIVPVDNKRYRYAYHRSAWLVAGKADSPAPVRLYAHPDCSYSGEQLRKQVVSFEKVKVTNNELDKQGQVILNSMHRYQPRTHLVMLPEGHNCSSVPDLTGRDYKTFVFPETVFTAVTAYQNQLITKLKIDSNPFAKGFRDSSRLTEFERDTFENLLGDAPTYMPATAPALLDPSCLTLEERTLMAARAHLMMRTTLAPAAMAAVGGMAGALLSPMHVPLPLPLLTHWAALQSHTLAAQLGSASHSRLASPTPPADRSVSAASDNNCSAQLSDTRARHLLARSTADSPRFTPYPLHAPAGSSPVFSQALRFHPTLSHATVGGAPISVPPSGRFTPESARLVEPAHEQALDMARRRHPSSHGKSS